MQNYIELAAKTVGMSEKEFTTLKNSEVSEYSVIDEMLHFKYGISLETFPDLIRDLLPLTVPQQSNVQGEFKYVMGVFDEDGFRPIVEAEVGSKKI